MASERHRQLHAEFASRGDAQGWFDALYREAGGDPAAIPWADLKDNPLFVAWRDRTGIDLRSRSSLVVGCGLGDDSETIAASGGAVTAFDLSPTAIEWCHKRFPASPVRYVTADLLQPPPEWRHAFGFVLEVYTLQALPANLRPAGMTRLAEFVAPGGTLLVICRAREASDPADGPPWPLVREELEALVAAGLRVASFDAVADPDDPSIRRFVAAFERPK
ncbi:MAG TPA: class I SAM-dependent methyltransferase [Vicinamibacterales bacterium]|nr:class I SAM-dependent methyltransferase [Vicinamibacterales bacterium]